MNLVSIRRHGKSMHTSNWTLITTLAFQHHVQQFIIRFSLPVHGLYSIKCKVALPITYFI